MAGGKMDWGRIEDARKSQGADPTRLQRRLERAANSWLTAGPPPAKRPKKKAHRRSRWKGWA